MESDVPLIEIAREDNSLIHDDNVSNSHLKNSTKEDTNFFCSPLQALRSKPLEVMMLNEDSQKLNLQPQQMKRKKKGAGYNLRKSMAWDRAFFTDEGVLNSEELSMISGNVNSGGLLSVIHEETNCTTESADFQALEEKLFKALPQSSSDEDRLVGGSSLTKHDSSARDNVAPGSAGKRKVLSTRDINRSGSKRSGCPRPVASSSLKRPANVNTINSATKEPKVSKLPVPKPVPCGLSRSSKNVTHGANDSKRNQMARPGNSDLAVNLINTKTGPNNAKVGPTAKPLAAKSSVRQARRNVASLGRCSPAKIPCPPVIEGNNGLAVISKQALPSASHASYGRADRSSKTAVTEVTSKQALPSSSNALYGRDDISRKTAVPLPHTGLNLPRTHLQTSKPSGLRMPSPSLGFFRQSKDSSLPSSYKTSSQPCKIPNLRQVGSVNPIHELRPPSSLVKTQNATIMGDIDIQCSSSGCSAPSTVNSATKDKGMSVSQIKNMQKLDPKVPSNSNTYKMTENQRKLNCISVHEDRRSMGQEEPYITENISHLEDVELQRGSCEDDKSMEVTFVPTPISTDMDKPHVISHLSSAVKFTGFSDKNDITDHQLLEEEPDNLPQNCGVFLKPKSGDASSSSMQSILVSHDDQSSSDHNVNEQNGQQADLFMPLTCEGNHNFNENPLLSENTGILTKERQASEEIQSYSFVKVADVSLKVQNCSASELRRSASRLEDQVKNDGSTFDTVSRNPHVADAQMLALGTKLTDEIKDVDLGTSSPDNCQWVMNVSGNEKPEHLDLPNPCYCGEQVFQDDRLLLNDCVIDEFSIFPEQSQQKDAHQCVQLEEPERTISCRSESENSRTISLTSPDIPDCWSNEVEMVESQNADNIALVSEDNKPVVENYNLDTQFSNDSQLHGQACSLELERMDEDQITGAVTAHNINATCSKSGDFMSQLKVTMQVEGGSAIKDIIECKDLGTNDCNLSVESCCHVSLLQPEDEISYCQKDTSIEQINLMSDKINFTGVMSGKINVDEHNAEQSPGDHGLSFEGSESFEECHRYNNGNSAYFSSKVKGSGGSGLQSPHVLSTHKRMDEANKEVRGSDMIKESVLGDPPEQSSVPSCAYSVVNDVYEPSGCPLLQHPNIGVVQMSQNINPGSCLNGTLLASKASCKEFDETVHELVFDHDACRNISKSSHVCTEEAPEMHDVRPDSEEKADYLQMEVAVTSSFKIDPSPENIQCYTNSRHDNKLSNQASSAESDLSAKTEENPVSNLAFSSLGGELWSSVISDQTSSSGSILQDNEVKVPSSKALAEEAEIKDATKELKKKSGSDRKQDAPVIKPPPDAVPFSDEWLAAIEAAGEEILTMKSGAVQNSPPNKSQPQLGPWSPVKRKSNQVIGPFDCTKYTNNAPSSQ